MYKRVLFFLDPDETRVDLLEELLDLITQLKSRLIVLVVVPPDAENASKEELERKEALEDRAWNILYQIEDIAFDREIKISLMVEEGDTEEVIASVVKSYNVDLASTFTYKKINPGRLSGRLGGVPLLLLNQEAR